MPELHLPPTLPSLYTDLPRRLDVDTLWRRPDGTDFLWKGRACKVYSKVGAEWKLIMHTGLLDYGG